MKELTIVLLSLAASVCLLVFAIVLPIRYIKRSYLNTTCPAFSRESGYETKIADYSFWSYDCLAQKENGKWISTSMLREED